MGKVWLWALLGMSVLLNLVLLGYLIFSPTTHSEFRFLSPEVARMSVDQFLERQHDYITSYSDLRPLLNDALQNRSGYYGVYFEDLTTGAWVGVNEREQFYPMSLLKVPVLVAVLKKVESGKISLEDEIVLMQEDIETTSGSLGERGPGAAVTIKELLELMIRDSDNTAVIALRRAVVTNEEHLEAGVAMGLYFHMDDRGVSPKEYSNILRSLYFSNYLRRPFSEYALRLMSESRHRDWLPAGIPSDVPIAHKVGYAAEAGIFHDCGIVYSPDRAYLLCVMSKNATMEEATAVMVNVSSTVYTYMQERNYAAAQGWSPQANVTLD